MAPSDGIRGRVKRPAHVRLTYERGTPDHAAESMENEIQRVRDRDAAAPPVPAQLPPVTRAAWHQMLCRSEDLRNRCILAIIAPEWEFCRSIRYPFNPGALKTMTTYTRNGQLVNGQLLGTLTLLGTDHAHQDHVKVPVARMSASLLGTNTAARAFKLEWLAENSAIVLEKRTARSIVNHKTIPFRGNIIAPLYDTNAITHYLRNGTRRIYTVVTPPLTTVTDEECIHFSDKAFGGNPEANAVNSTYGDNKGLIKHLILAAEVSWFMGGPVIPTWFHREAIDFRHLSRLETLALDVTHIRWAISDPYKSTNHLRKLFDAIGRQLREGGNPGLRRLVVVGLQSGCRRGEHDFFLPQAHQWNVNTIETAKKRPDNLDINWFKELLPLVSELGGQITLADRNSAYIDGTVGFQMEPHWGPSHMQLAGQIGVPRLHYGERWANPDARPANGWHVPYSWYAEEGDH